jgi:predicted nucleic-acid-binding Zn-ribbon protein
MAVYDAKPCPKCLNDDILWINEMEYYDMDDDDFGGEEVYIALHCGKCGLTGMFSSGEAGAISSWNFGRREALTVKRTSEKIVSISPVIS